MRLSSVLSEAVRDVRSGTTRFATFALLTAATAGLAGTADASAVAALTRDAVAYVAAGAATRTGTLEGGVDGRSCDALAGHADVAAAGALRAGPGLTLTSMPGTTLSTFEVSPGLAGLLADSDGRAGAWLSPELSRRLGASAGTELGTAVGPLLVAGVFPYPDDGRDARLASAVLLPGSMTRPFDECWARAWPQGQATDSLLLQTASSSAGPSAALSLGQLNASLGSTSPGAEGHERRLTRWAPLAAASVAALLGVVSVRRRRLELSGARCAGQTRTAQLAVVLLETSAWSTCGALVASGLTTLSLLTDDGASVDSPARLLVAAPAAAAAAAVLAAALTTTTIRRRDLVRWFKDR